MALPLAEAFTARSLGVMWDNYKKTLGTAPYLGRQKFGTRKQDSLDLRFIKGKNGLPVSLKASNFDAQAELRDVGGFSDIQNSMPFYREGYMVTEKEEQEYDNYRTSENSNLANNVLREISKKPMMLIEGALVVSERQIWQLLAPTDGVPKVKVVLGDKNYVVDYTADNGAEHKEKHFKSITGTSAWDKPTTCAPLTAPFIPIIFLINWKYLNQIIQLDTTYDTKQNIYHIKSCFFYCKWCIVACI